MWHWMSHHCDCFVLNCPCLSLLGNGMLFSYTIHFLMKVGCLHHRTRSESFYYTCYSRLIGCSPIQHLPKVGGDLWWSTTANFRFMVLSQPTAEITNVVNHQKIASTQIQVWNWCLIVPFVLNTALSSTLKMFVFLFSLYKIFAFSLPLVQCFSGNKWYLALSGFKLITMVRILLLKIHECIIICVSIS
jgi:hypothetical protein